MAPPIFFFFFLSLVIHASFSLTIPLDVKAVELPDHVHESVLTEKTPDVLGPHLRPSEEAELVQSLSLVDVVPSLNSGEGKHGKRVERSIILPKVKCAGDMIEHGGKCWTKYEYDQIIKDYEE